MAVITLSREPFSGGNVLGSAIAKELGYSLIDKRDFTAIFQEYGMITFDDFYSSPLTVWERVDEVQLHYMSFLKKVIQSAARMDNIVLVGRGSFAVLAGFTDVLNIRLWAPLDTRISRYMEQEGLSDYEKSAETVVHLDKIRQSFIAHCFHINEAQASNAFDLVFNTGKIDAADASMLVSLTARSLDRVHQKAGKTVADLVTDEILDSTIRKVLEEKI